VVINCLPHAACGLCMMMCLRAMVIACLHLNCYCEFEKLTDSYLIYAHEPRQCLSRTMTVIVRQHAVRVERSGGGGVL